MRPSSRLGSGGASCSRIAGNWNACWRAGPSAPAAGPAPCAIGPWRPAACVEGRVGRLGRSSSRPTRPSGVFGPPPAAAGAGSARSADPAVGSQKTGSHHVCGGLLAAVRRSSGGCGRIRAFALFPATRAGSAPGSGPPGPRGRLLFLGCMESSPGAELGGPALESCVPSWLTDARTRAKVRRGRAVNFGCERAIGAAFPLPWAPTPATAETGTAAGADPADGRCRAALCDSPGLPGGTRASARPCAAPRAGHAL